MGDPDFEVESYTADYDSDNNSNSNLEYDALGQKSTVLLRLTVERLNSSSRFSVEFQQKIHQNC
jgi:hypothetical protein